ncbi:MAG: RagB/SusD family nutrient uptake outer membrane protein [Chitinophagaceae bacterium]|nr:MAG: RagB/SusD family nutrient uptake outer membrane protein [Chitinophagaceae bacterium]
MKTFLNYFLSLLAVAAMTTGCKQDFLDRPPIDQLTSGNFYKTNDEIRAATGPLYNIVWFDYNDKAFLAFGEARGGNLNSNDRTAYIQFAVSSTDQSTLLAGYKSFYKIVGQANTIMAAIKNAVGSTASDAVKNEGVAECRFMRALAYYYLVSNWGAVPIVYDNVAQLSNTLRRNTIDDVWQFIIRDLTYATKHLPAVPYAQGRVSKWSAEGMLARMYLTRAGRTGGGTRNQADLDSAKFYAGDVISNSGLSLLPAYADLFRGAYNNSDHVNPNPESLFSLQWAGASQPWGINNSFQAYVAFDPSITQTGDGWGAAQGISADLVKYYMANPADSFRRKATAMFHDDFYGELNQANGGTLVTGTGMSYIKKYVVGSPADNGGKGNFMAAYINTYMLRLAEVYLIYADAVLGNSASTSDATALSAFNMVRERAGLGVKSQITFSDIFSEKRVELAMEGNAWYEILRWYYFDPAAAIAYVMAQDRGNYTISHVGNTNEPRQYSTTFTPAHFTFNDQSVYLPFPESELNVATGLSQEPVPFDFSVLPE